ncbi:MAG TPA: hypothetical protein VHO01_13545 [Jatrophihabitans sp.]|nr:hypothetical protein [Jatrophihabitans sp.]
MSMHDIIGTDAEISYRQQQVARQYRTAARRSHHRGRLLRWREIRRHHAA